MYLSFLLLFFVSLWLHRRSELRGEMTFMAARCQLTEPPSSTCNRKKNFSFFLYHFGLFFLKKNGGPGGGEGAGLTIDENGQILLNAPF